MNVLSMRGVVECLERRICEVDARIQASNGNECTSLHQTAGNLQSQLTIARHAIEHEYDEHQLMQWSEDYNHLIVASMYAVTNTEYDQCATLALELMLRYMCEEDPGLIFEWFLSDLRHVVGVEEMVRDPRFIRLVHREMLRFQSYDYSDFAWDVFNCFLDLGLYEEALGFGVRVYVLMQKIFGSGHDSNTFLSAYLDFLRDAGESVDLADWLPKLEVYLDYVVAREEAVESGFAQ